MQDGTVECISSFSNDIEEECSDTEQQKKGKYKHRKPIWWTQISRKGSKAQRRAIKDMADYLLPRTVHGTFIDWNTSFGRAETETLNIWLEIGFGAGDNLLQLAKQYPDKYFVGAEIHQPGVGKIMQKIKYGTENKCYWTGSCLYSSENDSRRADADSVRGENVATENPYGNVRIYQGDGVQLLSRIPSRTLEAVLVTNPDPFPDDDQREWRLFQVHTLLEIRRVLVPSGRLYLATDHEGFFSWSHDVMKSTNTQEEVFRAIDPLPSRRLWLPVVSEYEQRGLENGRKPLLSCWEAL
ncbi:tRNA (guanine-N7-)-methyltransferase [Fistulifera solaris]|uniref:tRNA (guanine(46)-N(7))-methyltransferase n=1 Tax=Fistulifera solaris TaxID=1519565 RepID=A0A1Z5K7X6_FISSO|nr:tRNA (guanine-N7-)-methyltransferase [Fistulifera solaris]|eukprot:GAX22334.1 tRNA (guanine-N7-)-methyltransferase [Fistulifera solaris]